MTSHRCSRLSRRGPASIVEGSPLDAVLAEKMGPVRHAYSSGVLLEEVRPRQTTPTEGCGRGGTIWADDLVLRGSRAGLPRSGCRRWSSEATNARGSVLSATRTVVVYRRCSSSWAPCASHPQAHRQFEHVGGP